MSTFGRLEPSKYEAELIGLLRRGKVLYALPLHHTVHCLFRHDTELYVWPLFASEGTTQTEEVSEKYDCQQGSGRVLLHKQVVPKSRQH
jgi:hypothetical protein